MNIRFFLRVLGISVLFFAAGPVGKAFAQANGTEGQTSTPPMSVYSPSMHQKELFISGLGLSVYGAAAGDLSLCLGGQDCIEHAKRIKSWFCVKDICNQPSAGKEPSSCFDNDSQKYSVGALEQANSLACSLIKSPSAESRKAFLNLMTGMEEYDLVESQAYIAALNGSATACESIIKDYVGGPGSTWDSRWYTAMSGCRILAKQRTRQQEEKDFSAWFDGKCKDILNPEMRDACNVSGLRPV